MAADLRAGDLATAAVSEDYKLVLASSVGGRDGMGIEVTDNAGRRLAEVFESGDTGLRTVNVFVPDVPLRAMELLLSEARNKL